MSTVYVREAKYDYSSLKPIIYDILDSSIAGSIGMNSRVVIKPNFLAPASPDSAVVTHPLVVKAAAEYVIDKGAKPVISDSPAIDSFEKILKTGGFRDALNGMEAEFKPFTKAATFDAGKPFGNVEISHDALNADFLINLPKVKTHAQMTLTLGIKNLFGCILGMKKPEWHFRAGVDREMFARLLMKIYEAINPCVTLIDGILAMEGQGPGKGGTPREIGVILGSSDTVALDNVVSEMLGMAPQDLLTNKVASDMGLAPDEISIDGTLPEVKNYIFPQIGKLVFGPERFHGLIRKHLVQRPVCRDSQCELCSECWKYCPADAIKVKNKKLKFDYEKCIRCYCCIEVCPHGALKARETLPGKIGRKVLKMQ